MSLLRYFVRCYTHHYVDFSGRASRREYWGFVLFSVLIHVLLLALGIALFFPWRPLLEGEPIGSIFVLVLPFLIAVCPAYLYNLVSLLPSISVLIRRLHDVGLSGWWLLVAMLPYGLFMIFSFLNAILKDKMDSDIFIVPMYITMGLNAMCQLALFITTLLPGNRGSNQYGFEPLEQ